MTWIEIWKARKQVLYGLIIGSLVWAVWWLRGHWDAAAMTRAVDHATQTERQACIHNQQLSEDIDYAYHLQTADIDARTATDLQRLCEPHLQTAARPPSRSDGEARQPELPAKRGIDAWALVTRAGACDKQAHQLDALQRFVREVWSDNGQPIP